MKTLNILILILNYKNNPNMVAFRVLYLSAACLLFIANDNIE